ncbi:MAG: hypothetical protein ABIV13_03045 [Fimbriimonadales bacterium]
MKKPSKKEIRDRLEKLKGEKPGPPGTSPPPVGKPEPKKANKNRIRKQGV